ncbi:MAG: hypothetical protein H0T92_22285 [Pyrinomonadaceae bacterium]|nr:hypothetical protein [Pyrinomonadaceae bacterium]
MNCEKFELIINDLARDQMMDAVARENGLSHIKACAVCTARFADQCKLTSGLRAFAASASMERAPAHTEAALRTMFRERAKVNLFTSSPVALTSASAQRHWVRWALTAAAAVLVLVVLTTLRWQRWSIVPDQGAREAYAPQLKPTIDIVTSDEQAPSSMKTIPESMTGKQKDAPQPLIVRAARSTRRSTPRPHRSGISNVDPSLVREPVRGSEMQEVATAFLPLVAGSNFDSLESGQVVRVELPRSALVSFGLPMNEERADEPIKADVLLGEDGVARAVRFVTNN